jgi:hypothetical protein
MSIRDWSTRKGTAVAVLSGLGIAAVSYGAGHLLSGPLVGAIAAVAVGAAGFGVAKVVFWAAKEI